MPAHTHEQMSKYRSLTFIMTGVEVLCAIMFIYVL